MFWSLICLIPYVHLILLLLLAFSEIFVPKKDADLLLARGGATSNPPVLQNRVLFIANFPQIVLKQIEKQETKRKKICQIFNAGFRHSCNKRVQLAAEYKLTHLSCFLFP